MRFLLKANIVIKALESNVLNTESFLIKTCINCTILFARSTKQFRGWAVQVVFLFFTFLSLMLKLKFSFWNNCHMCNSPPTDSKCYESWE